MLHHRHQFHMSIPHLLHIWNQLIRNIPVVCISLPLSGRGKGAQIHFIDADRRIPALEFLSFLNECVILPGKAPQIRYNRGRLRTQLSGVSVRICLQIGHAPFQL